MKIRAKITSSLILAAVIPLASAMIIAIRHSTDYSKAATIHLVESKLDAQATSLQSFLQSRISEIDAMAASPILATMDWDQIGPWLRDRHETTSNVWEKFILGDPEGHFYNTAGGNPGVGGLRTFDDKDPSAKPKSIAKRDYWQATIPNNPDAQRRVMISEPMISYTTGAKQIVVAASILRDGEVVGMIGGALPWDLFEARLFNTSELLRQGMPEESVFALIAPSGVYWYHTNPENIVYVERDKYGEILKGEDNESVVHYTNILDEEDPVLRGVGELLAEKKSGVAVSKSGSEDRYDFYKPIGDLGYSMLLEVPEFALMKGVDTLRAELFLVLAIAAPMASMVAFFVARRLTKPLSKLAEAANGVARGEFQLMPESGEGEIKEVTQAFNRLLIWLEESNREKDEADQLRFDAVVNQLSDALAIISSQGQLIHTNQPFDWLFDQSSAVGSIWDVVPWTGSEEDWRERLEMVREGKSVSFECSVGDAYCRQSYEFSMCGVIQQHDIMVVVIGHDVTERAEQAKLLANARQQAESANETKSEFLANMSHEIRTPLTSILGFADVLKENADNSKTTPVQVKAIHTIRQAGEHLLTLINDILDLSKIEAGKVEVEQVDTLLPKVLQGVEEMVRTRAEDKGLSLTVDVSYPILDRAMIDPTRLRQILVNLVGNAIKFTDAGEIQIRVSAPVKKGQYKLRVEIEDSGSGMTDNQVGNLFKPFSQADGSITRKFGGTGLGLTISRRLACLMGGEVWLDSTAPDIGSTFILEIPVCLSPGSSMLGSIDEWKSLCESQTNKETSKHESVLNGRILLAEDGKDNQHLLSIYLRKAGATLDIADNGRIALDMIEAADSVDSPYDLLLTDVQMPEMDGHTLAKTLRNRGNNIPIVALTAHAMAEDRQRCIDAGCNDYASKPVNRAALIATCAEWIGRSIDIDPVQSSEELNGRDAA
jgi:signal transduction histidine kinase/ActR/RegA family two-component response regulator